MNLHVPQTIEAEVEIMVSSRCALHIVSAQRNAPVNGIVQDGLVASYMLTNEWEDENDPITMIDKDTAMKIYRDAEIPEHRIKDLIARGKLFYPEYIIDGQFTDNIPGSLFVSILFPPNFCYTRTTETHPIKPDVIVEDGILTPKSGPLCVKSIGGKNGSIVHYLWKISPEVALYFISDLQQITDRWLPTHGFSMGIRDCFASNEKDVAKILIETRMKVDEVIRKGETPDRLEVEINSELNSAMAVGPKLAKNSMDKGDRNALNIMRNSGAKGSVINLAQIAAFVGQQNIKGKRMPMQLSHNSRCLPSFLPGDLSPEARGFVEHNYLRGLTPQEAFFHAGAGRDGVIATALKSVTGDTPIVIIDHTGNSKYVLIGDWIDEQLLKNADKVEHHTEREMELLNVEELNMSIPTADECGTVTWGLIKNITRHDPGKELYEIKTLGGRQVIVTESKSLLIWDEDLEEFHGKLTPKVRVGDYVPVTMNLATPPIITRYIDVSRYLPKTEYVYGTDFVLAEAEMEAAMVGRIRIPAGWWQKNNGKTFTLPYTKKSSLTRTRSGRSNTGNIKEGCVYPYSAMRGEMMIPDKLELNKENGIFIGLFLAEGNVDIKSGYVQITNMNKNIQSFVKSWFDKLSIKHATNIKTTDMGKTEDVRGYSTILAKLLTELVGHGARNKYVPNEAFTAPEEFIIGLLNGYFSGDGTLGRGDISVCSASKRLIMGVNMLLSRLGIFGRVSISQLKSDNLGTVDIAAMNTISVRGQWARIFMDEIDMVDNIKHDKLQKLEPTYKHRNFSEHNDVVLDKIVEINKVDVSLHPKVYDLTIPSTLNFGIANGLQLEDTAETGYMQKKIARKVEDFKIWIDGTVRDANGRVISFMYGDDGMDPKKLVSVKGMNVPYFVNPHFLAKQLNSDAKRSAEVTQHDEPRILKQSEIELLLSIVCFSKIKSTVIENVNENNRKILAKIIEDVKLYDCKIADFFVSIKDIYNNSKASYGLPVGLIAASSLGEPATQMVLNTFHLAGIKSKDASSGVPRYKELNNATKTRDQKKPSCEIWFNDLSIQENAKIIRQLENEDKVSQCTKNAEKITKLKQETLEYVQLLRNKFEETYVGDFLIDYEMKYLSKNVSPETGASPTGLITYEEYSEDWWVTLSKNMGKVEVDRDAESWVICLYFDVEKLYRHRIDLEDISMAIEEYSGSDFMCIISPTVIGRIEVYTSLSELKSRACVKLGIEEGEDASESDEHYQKLVTEDNIEYYICRDVAINFIKRTQISGIKGITKIYPREDTTTHEYIVDTDGINFLEVLTSPNVDSTRTVCDDMHTIRSVLGIEATRTFLFKEVKRVISFDGTYVNPRHISVLVDAMTVNGCLDAASRDGISRDVGPNAKIMFEKNIDNAAVASVFTEKDTMASLSSSVMYGKLANIGSGAVSIASKEKI